MTTIHSVHVKTYDSEGQKQMNSPEFKKHLAAQQGEVHYASDKGVAFKFKHDYHAAAFHRGIQSHFKHLDSENDGKMNEAKDSREYGYEGEMVMSQLKGIMAHAEQLNGMLKPDTDLPEWVQSKITLAYDYLQTAADYMSSEMKEDVSTNAMGTGQVANPDNKLLFKKPIKRFKKFTGKK